MLGTHESRSRGVGWEGGAALILRFRENELRTTETLAPPAVVSPVQTSENIQGFYQTMANCGRTGPALRRSVKYGLENVRKTMHVLLLPRLKNINAVAFAAAWMRVRLSRRVTHKKKTPKKNITLSIIYVRVASAPI